MNDIDYEPDMDPGRCCCGYVEGHGPDPRPSKSYIDGLFFFHYHSPAPP